MKKSLPKAEPSSTVLRILFLSQAYLPSRRASGIQTMRMCSALASLGHSVTLLAKAPRPGPLEIEMSIFEFYGIEPSFEIVRLERASWRGGGLLLGWAQRRFLKSCLEDFDFIMSRDIVGSWLAIGGGVPMAHEWHGPPEGLLGRWVWRRLQRANELATVVFISKALSDEFGKHGSPRPEANWLVAHDGATTPFSQQRKPILDGPATRVGYAGHLYKGRGIELILELASELPGLTFDIVGGTEEDVRRCKGLSQPQNVTFHGFVPPAELPQILSQFDILLMPYQREVHVASGRSETSRWMSPMKMFEYMGTGAPIIASDLPVLREVLADGRNALLVPPEDVDEWARAVRRLSLDQSLRNELAARALCDLEQHYTWEKRANRVLEASGFLSPRHQEEPLGTSGANPPLL